MISIISWMISSVENVPTEVSKNNEDQQWKGFSVFLHVLLPIAGLALLWGQKGLFSKLLLQLDRSCVAVYCPSLSKREKLLKWASNRLPLTWSSQARTLSSGIPELWKDGSILCTLINSVVPGACPNPHRHWRKPPLHAQALAYKYLGLVPMFTEDELSSDLTVNQERKFVNYLYKLQEAINKWSTHNDISHKLSSQYVARGMGLYTAEQYRKTVFYIYASKTTKKRSNVLMYIRGPYDTHGKATISPFHSLKTIPVVNVLQDQLEATKIIPFKSEEQKSFLKTISLDFTSLVNGVESENDKNEIPIQIDMEIDRAKITYIPHNTGIYEITLICDGELLKGSPYIVQVTENTSGKKDEFSVDCDQIKEKITFTKRKIISKVIDCIDEKICIDNDSSFKIQNKESNESFTENQNNDLIITAVTKKEDEILKTQINCTLEEITEEINSVQECPVNDKIHKKNIEGKKQDNNLTEIKQIAEQFKTEEAAIAKVNQHNENKTVRIKVDSKHKIVRDTDEAQKEIIDSLQCSGFDEVDTSIRSPNKTEENINKPSLSKFDLNIADSTKYFKSMMNCNSIQLEKTKQDENNNVNGTPLKLIKSKISVEISPKVIHKTSPQIIYNPTSPICPDHIAPEVKESTLNKLTLSEKRKTFSKQASISIPNSDLTISTSENENISKSGNSSYKDLSVLNVLDSLKKSRKPNLSESCSLYTTNSLPNIGPPNSNSENTEKISFEAKRNYWETLSSQSSSNISLANSSQSRKRDIDKNYFKKSSSIEKDIILKDENVRELEKLKNKTFSSENNSADEALSSYSTDTSLEDCSIVPLEERKKLLLKNMYKQDTREAKNLNVKVNYFKKNGKPKKEENVTYFSPISERVQTFDKIKLQEKIQTSSKLDKKSSEKTHKEECEKKSTKETIKSQFKKAIRFFKKLEENSSANQEVKRKYSLNQQKKNCFRFRSNSLNLPNISDRFSINDLYKDVFHNKSGSFKGIPNRKGVINSLSSFPKRKTNLDIDDQDELSYNLFVSKTKSKKRKSIKSLFDINY